MKVELTKSRVTVSGGTGPYLYEWADNVTTEDDSSICIVN